MVRGDAFPLLFLAIRPAHFDGIDVVHHLPGVGKNFQDHMDVYLTATTAPVSYNQEDRPDRAIR